LFYLYNTEVTVDQLEENINECVDVYLVSNFKSVQVQTDTIYYVNEEILRNNIKILQQKLKRKNKKLKI